MRSFPLSPPTTPTTTPTSRKIESAIGNVSGLTKVVAIAKSAPATPAYAALMTDAYPADANKNFGIPSINAFFDKVLVMAEEEQVRQNRLALVGQIANLSTGIADLSKLEGF